jgi:hypothetical protein
MVQLFIRLWVALIQLICLIESSISPSCERWIPSFKKQSFWIRVSKARKLDPTSCIRIRSTFILKILSCKDLFTSLCTLSHLSSQAGLLRYQSYIHFPYTYIHIPKTLCHCIYTSILREYCSNICNICNFQVIVLLITIGSSILISIF